jgi:hypothetical protein
LLFRLFSNCGSVERISERKYFILSEVKFRSQKSRLYCDMKIAFVTETTTDQFDRPILDKKGTSNRLEKKFSVENKQIRRFAFQYV